MHIRWCLTCAAALGGCGLLDLPKPPANQPSPALVKFAQSLKSFETGGGIDFDGDGNPDNTVTVNGNVRVFTDPVNRITITFTGADTVDATGDLNGDDKLDWTFHGQRTGNVAVEDESQDIDFDGTDDRKVHRVFTDGSPPTLDETVQTLQTPDGGTTSMFVVSSSRSGPAFDSDGRTQDSCDPQAGFPADTSGTFEGLPLPNTHIRVPINGKPGACTKDQADTILTVLMRDVLPGLDKCLGHVNPGLRDRLATHLKDAKLVIGCGNTCPGVAINTQLPGTIVTWWQGEQHMNINYPIASNGTQGGKPVPDDAVLAEYLTHELTHFAGEDHPDGVLEELGRDLPYGCGRFCNKCKTIATNGGARGTAACNADCARCADVGRRTQCGEYVQVDGAGDCVKATAASAVTCGQMHPICPLCLYHHGYSCDGTQLFTLQPAVECCTADDCLGITNYPCMRQNGDKYNNTCDTKDNSSLWN
jgi:hypothetical protein